jgi:hypothetical protein
MRLSIFSLLSLLSLSLTEAKLNFVFILADDLGIGEINQQSLNYSFFLDKKLPGSPYYIKTPTIEKISQNSTMYDNVWAATVCGPSRHMLLTGINTHKSRLRGNVFINDKNINQIRLPNVTLPKILQQMGYTTVISGKYGFGRYNMKSSATNMGFNYSFIQETHVDAHYPFPSYMVKNNKVINFKKNRYANINRCLNGRCVSADDTSLSFTLDMINECHSQRIPFAIFDMPLYNHVGTFDGKHIGNFVNSYEGLPSKWNADIKGHIAMIIKFDNRIREIYKRLEQLDIAENTVLVISSDNGAEYFHQNGRPIKNQDIFKSTGYRKGNKRSMYEGGLNVPLLIHLKGKTRYLRNKFPFTFADLSNSIPRIVQTGNLTIDAPKNYVISENCENGEKSCIFAVLDVNTFDKLIYDNNQFSLYNLKNDPYENILINNDTIKNKLRQVWISNRIPL